MRAILICPAERPEVSALAEKAPLSNLPLLGKPLLYYWIEHLAGAGATEIRILAADRPEEVRAIVGDGARWGVRISVIPVMRELSPHEARLKYRRAGDHRWVMAPLDVTLVDCLPGKQPHSLFASYEAFFQETLNWIPQAASSLRVGMKEMRPGIWVGLNAHISPEAELVAPCWLGNQVHIGKGAVVGPGAILEDHAVLEPGVTVVDSIVGPSTAAGSLTLLQNSIAMGNRLINWKLRSRVEVPDSFLLCAIGEQLPPIQRHSWHGRFVALLLLIVTAPALLSGVLYAAVRRQRALVVRTAVRPGAGHRNRTIEYYEMAGGWDWWRRLPQLWSIVRGDFAWFGNPPLTSREAGWLGKDFERLWFHAPVGFFSTADSTGHREPLDDDVIAHAVYYATQASLPLRWEIFCGILRRLWSSKAARRPLRMPALKRSSLALDKSAAS
jgi:hypothetical protein